MDGATLATIFSTSQSLLEANVDGITHVDSLIYPEKGGNCINWIAGHILNSRGTLLGVIGGKPFLDEEEGKIYGRKSTPDLSSNAVKFDRILDGLISTGNEVVGRLNSITDKEMSEILDSSRVPVKLPVPSLAAIVQLYIFHEAYHVGQTGFCRRVLGHKPAAI